jgi:hypothetical protein
MTTIKAKWNEGTWMDGDSLPMCSASERDEMFLVGEKWKYELPKGYSLFATPAKLGDCIEVVGEKDGTEVLVGYACPVVYVLMATVFKSYEDCYNSEFFHPSDYIECRIEDAAKAVKQQEEMLENECYGD